MDDRNSTSGRSSEEIRAEIDRTRAEMHNTVDQLEARLSPGQILDELWGRMRSNGGGGAGELVREHPVPLALMGLGVAMLAVEHSKHKNGHDGSAHGYIGDQGRAEGRKGPYRGDDVDHIKFSDLPSSIGSTNDTGADGDGSGIKNRLSGAMHGAADKLGDVKDGLSDAASGLKDRASHLAEDASERLHGAGERLHGAGERASELRGRAGEKAGEAVRGLDRIIHDQPLIAGAITFGLGLAAGLAVPTTRFEDERMGRTSDQVKDSAKQVASEAGEKALEVAGQAVATAKEAASEIKDEINDPELKDALVTKARTIVDVAKNSVGDSMQTLTGSLAASRSDSEAGTNGSSQATTADSTRTGSTGGLS